MISDLTMCAVSKTTLQVVYVEAQLEETYPVTRWCTCSVPRYRGAVPCTSLETTKGQQQHMT